MSAKGLEQIEALKKRLAQTKAIAYRAAPLVVLDLRTVVNMQLRGGLDAYGRPIRLGTSSDMAPRAHVSAAGSFVGVSYHKSEATIMSPPEDFPPPWKPPFTDAVMKALKKHLEGY